jgi:hypothetical protein
MQLENCAIWPVLRYDLGIIQENHQVALLGPRSRGRAPRENDALIVFPALRR